MLKFAALFFLLLLSIAFVGCVQEKKPTVIIAINQSESQQVVSNNGSSWAENFTPPSQDEPSENPFANLTPRNISDRIGDGSFLINEQIWAPLKIYAIEDGYADSVLINRGEFYMLVDAGEHEPVAEFLHRMGIERLNVVAASRDYPGAIGGLSGILDGFEVDEFWDNGLPAQSEEYKALLEKVSAKRIPIKHPQEGEEMKVSGISVLALNPQKQRMFGNPDTDAIVLKIGMNDFCVALLNPTIQDIEKQLMGEKANLKCDVVTYFKHGEGRPEPSVMVEDYISPKDVIVSVGSNKQGLPSNTTLARLELNGMNVWRTDKGTIYIESNGIDPYSISSIRYNETTEKFEESPQ